ALRTDLRPPQIDRLPDHRPLSRLKGASPTKALISCRLSCPSSGSSATSVAETTGPTPGTLLTIRRLRVAGMRASPRQQSSISPPYRGVLQRLSASRRFCILLYRLAQLQRQLPRIDAQ